MAIVTVTDEAQELWDVRHSHMTPEGFSELLLEPLAENHRETARVDIFKAGSDVAKDCIFFEIYTDTVTLTFCSRPDKFVVMNIFRGEELGEAPLAHSYFIRNVITEALKVLGSDTITTLTFAAQPEEESLGIWARMGFYPSSEQWQQDKEMIRVMLEKFRGQILPKDFDRIDEWIESEDPSTIGLIAKDKTPVKKDDGKPSTLGKELLKNISYDVEIDLTEPLPDHFQQLVDRMDARQESQRGV